MTLSIVFSIFDINILANIDYYGNIAAIVAGVAALITLVTAVINFYLKKERFKKYINIKIKKYQHPINQLTESISSELEIQKEDNKNPNVLLNVQKDRTQDKLRGLKNFLIHEIEDKNNIGKNKILTQKIEKRIKEIDYLIQKLNNKREWIDNWDKIHKQLKKITDSF